MRQQQFVRLGSAILSLLVIVWVFTRLDWADMRQVLSQVTILPLVGAFLSFTFTYLLRTLRFRLLLTSPSGQFLGLFGVTSLYGFFTYFLPVQSGELSYPLLLKRYRQITLTESAATLLAARVFDFVTIALLIPFVLIAFWPQIAPGIRVASLLFCFMVYLGFVVLLFFLWHQEKVTTPVDRPQSGWRGKLNKGWYRFVAEILAIRQRGIYSQLGLLTLGIWLSTYLTLLLVVQSLGYQPTYFQVMVVSMVMIPLTLFPVQGFANLGTHELAWVSVFTLFGYAPTTALTIAASSHLVLIAFILVSGSVGWGIVQCVSWRESSG